MTVNDDITKTFDQAYSRPTVHWYSHDGCRSYAYARTSQGGRPEAVLIRHFQPADWPQVWSLLHATIQPGDTFAFAPESSETEMNSAWIESPAATFVACDADGRLLGTYFIKPNQPGLGAHVCNCGYAVAPAARGKGVATAMCEHSQAEAAAMGYRAMQFNLVVSTNERAVQLWQRLGYEVVGRLPGAFDHRKSGYVDALVMFKQLKVL